MADTINVVPAHIPPLRKGQANSYKPEDIRRWGGERFLNEGAPKEPVPVPDLGFTEEENKRTDEIMHQERKQKI